MSKIPKFKDRTGEKIGRLTALYYFRKRNSSGESIVYWHCKCDCGNEIDVSSIGLGRTTNSCGCLKTDKSKQNGKKNKKYNTYDLSGEYGIGYTYHGEEFYFDLEDYKKIKYYCWYVDCKGYMRAKLADGSDGITLMHRLLMNAEHTKFQIDHINGKRADNRKSNLRIANEYGLNKNSINKSIQKNNKSGCPGVIWHNRDCIWEVSIGYNNKSIYLGRYNNYDEAVKVRKNAEKIYFKEWSYDSSRKGVDI